MLKVKTILFSHLQIPYDKIGSWSNLYNNMLIENQVFDYIICPTPKERFDAKYIFLRRYNILTRLLIRLNLKSRFLNYFNAIDDILCQNYDDTIFLIHIVDNAGLIIPLHNYLQDKKVRSKFYLQYYYHGFEPIYDKNKGITFLRSLDEMLFITKLSYKAFLNFYNEFTPIVRIIHNGVDSNRFFIIDKITRDKERAKLNLDGKIVFLWCSLDRPKKGLDLILKVWNRIYNDHNGKIILLVVGSQKLIDMDGVVNIGYVDNSKLAKYYQMSDVYLFPSLWKEGFGLALAEAIKCGCYCIASNRGGIKEVLQNGDFGELIDCPNLIEEWEIAMNNAILKFSDDCWSEEIRKHLELKSLYDFETWSDNIKRYLNEAKINHKRKYLM